MSTPLDLYHPLILEHHKKPSNFEVMVDPDVVIEAYNPICGDQFQIYFRELENGLIEVSFQGYGCAVSNAATSLLTEHLQERNRSEAVFLLEEYLKMLDSPKDIEGNRDPLHIFRKVRDFPGRWECATLSAQSILNYLKPPK